MALGTETMDRVDMIAGPGQRLRGRGQAPALRRGGHRPVRRTRPRSWSSPTTTPTRSWSPSTCSPRPSTVRSRRPSWSPPATALGRAGDASTSSRSCRPCRPATTPSPAWRDYGQVDRRRRPRRGLRGGRLLRRRARAGADREPASGAGQDARLRRALPRREHLRLLRRQGDRHQPRAADPRRRPLHRRPVGREVPARRSPTRRSPTTPSSAELGRVCGRAARVELFEGHARSGDVRAWKLEGDQHDWIDAALAPSLAEASRS